ncbi:uncharacterized protein LOC124274007 [Haliotis rubra]|uniref:uncharacterized protein LOC124274007 n=1 Tax=Haliotis rubra TaxID=36100 RepID=UPI001EE53857|nr:uncharacterized protein LOC124274007 [Haliotis rubra]
MGMNIGNTGNIYTCQADVDDGIGKRTITSEEYEFDSAYLQNPYIVSPPLLDRQDVHMTCLAYVRIFPAVSPLNVYIIWKTNVTTIGRQGDYSVTTSTLDEDWISSNLTTHSKHGDRYSCLVELQQGFRSEWSEPSTLNTNFSTQGNSTVRDGYDVKIRWKVTPLIKAVHLITNSFGRDIFVVDNLRIKVSSQYIARIRLGPIISSPKYGILSFTLSTVTPADAGRMTSRRASLVSPHNVSHSDGYLLIVIPNTSGQEKTNTAGQQDVTVTVTNAVPNGMYIYEHAFPVAIVAGLSVVSLLIICGIS